LRPVKGLYSPRDLEAIDFETEIGSRRAPFTRGIHATGYRGRLWTMRQFAGFWIGIRYEWAVQIPARARPDWPLNAFDLPTLMGYDSDHPYPRAKSASVR
jgi:methylmalonyl-CoA mutase N-terminal domain/subunit